MSLLTVPASGLTLDTAASTTKPGAESANLLSLTLSDDVIEDMIKCVRSGGNMSLTLGKKLAITYGDYSQSLSTTDDPFTHELFRSPYTSRSKAIQADSATSEMEKSKRTASMGIFNQQHLRARAAATRTHLVGKDGTRTPQMPFKSTASDKDDALAALDDAMASEGRMKHAKTTQQVKNSKSLPPPVQKKGSAQPLKAGSKTRYLTPANNAKNSVARSVTNSPALQGTSSPSLAPTSVPLSEQKAQKDKEIRFPIIHLLAVGPSTEQDLLKHKPGDCTEAGFRVNLEKVADQNDGKFELKQRSYKDLDVWRFEYEHEDDREKAIKNAVRIYDKTRTDLSAPEWERLLKKEERGTGKCLSKLQAKIASGTALPPKASNQRTEEQTAVEGGAEDLFGDTNEAAKASGQSSTAKPKKTSEREAQAKRLLAKPGKAAKPPAVKPAVERKAQEKKAAEKESSRVKSSKFVSESEEDEAVAVIGSEIATKRPPTSKPAMKRIYDDTDSGDASTPLAKKAKSEKTEAAKTHITTQVSPINKHRTSDASRVSQSSNVSNPTMASTHSKTTSSTSPSKSSPLASSPPLQAHDIDDPYHSSSSSYVGHPSLKRRPENHLLDSSNAKRHQKTFSTSSASSSGSGGSRTPSPEIMRLAVKFKAIYVKYAELYHEMNPLGESGRDSKPEKMQELHALHERLVRMKEEIVSSARAEQADA